MISEVQRAKLATYVGKLQEDSLLYAVFALFFWNAFQDEDYGFEFKIEIDHNYYESGNGYDEPMTYDMIPTSWEIELINVFDADENEIRLNKYEIADVEEYIHRNVYYSLRLVQ